jgi:hypothetical protein
MKIFTRMMGCAATAMVMSAVLFYFADAWLGEETTVVEVGRKLVFEASRNQALRARAEMVTHSLAIKRDIIAQVMAGRLHLREAIDLFHKANDMIENVHLELVPVYRLPTDSEGVGLQVLAWVRNEVASWPPEKAQPLLANLETEFRTLFGHPPLRTPSLDGVPNSSIPSSSYRANDPPAVQARGRSSWLARQAGRS